MKLNDIVKLNTHSVNHTRGIIGSHYKIAEIKKTEVKLCSIEDSVYCFYAEHKQIELVVQMSVPGSYEFDLPYNMDHTGSDLDIDKKWKVPESADFGWHLDKVVEEITKLLKSKNKAYGNTALNPTNIFSKLSATEAICARIDDKLARINNRGITDETEDTVDDLIGYLLLLKMSMQ